MVDSSGKKSAVANGVGIGGRLARGNVVIGVEKWILPKPPALPESHYRTVVSSGESMSFGTGP